MNPEKKQTVEARFILMRDVYRLVECYTVLLF